jgi:hypothetical protein
MAIGQQSVEIYRYVTRYCDGSVGIPVWQYVGKLDHLST